MSKVDVKKLKVDAEKYRGKGKLDKAIELYEQIDKAGGSDAKQLQKMAEIYLKLDRDQEGVNTYLKAMKNYAEIGFLVQAIAVGKILQGLCPDDEEINKEVNAMLAKKIGGTSKLLGHKEAPQPGKPKVDPEPPPEESTPEETTPEEEATTPEKPAAEEPPVEPVETPAKAAASLSADAAAGGENIEPGPDEPLGNTATEEPIETEEPAGPEKEDDINYLLFSSLSPEEFQRIYAKLRSVKIPHGLRICRDGDDGDSIFIIAQGEAEVTKKNEKGEERLLAKLTPGMFFGEMAYFMDGKRHATVEAVTDVQLLELSKKDMDEVTAEFPSVKEIMLSFYKERVLENLLVLSPLTAILSSEDRQKLISKFELREFVAEQPIVKEGEPGDAMFLIKSGKVEVSTTDPKEKKKLVLASLGPGDFFGEVSLIKNKPRTATIIALTPMEVLVINRKSFDELTREHPEMVSLLEQTIEKRVEDTIKKIIGEPK